MSKTLDDRDRSPDRQIGRLRQRYEPKLLKDRRFDADEDTKGEGNHEEGKQDRIGRYTADTRPSSRVSMILS